MPKLKIRGIPDTLTASHSGTRPGDALADLLYAFLMVRFTTNLRAQMEAHDLHQQYPLQWIPPGPVTDEDLRIQASWVDDLVVMLQADTPTALLFKVQQTIAIVETLATEFALQLNYKRDKTSVLLALRGPQAQKTWQKILQDNPADPKIPFVCPSKPNGTYLAISPDYIYLGQFQNGQGHPAEVRRKFDSAKALGSMLRKNIFRSPKMPLRSKIQL